MCNKKMEQVATMKAVFGLYHNKVCAVYVMA